MSRLPGHRLHSLSEMQLMSQNSAQRAAGRVDVLEKAMGALQRKQQETSANLAKVIDTLQLHQQALDSVIKRVDSLLAEYNAATVEPKRKPGRPRGSKNKPKERQETAPREATE